MKHSWIFFLAVTLLVVAAEVHAQTDVRPKAEPAPCDNTCVSAPKTTDGTAGSFSKWWYEMTGYYPPRITTYTGGTNTSGPTISSYVPPVYPQTKTGMASPACKTAVEIHLKTLLLSGLFDDTFLETTHQMVKDACFPDASTRDVLEGDPYAYAVFEEDLLVGAWIVDTWDPLLY